MLTYIIIAVFYQKSYTLALNVRTPGFSVKPFLCHRDIAQELAIGEPPAGFRVDNGGGLGVVSRNRPEDGQTREREGRSHSDAD